MTNWYKDAFNNEVLEFERVTNDLTADRESDDEWKMMFNKLKKSYNNETIKVLNDRVWAKLENTDSWSTTTINKVNKAILDNSEGSGKRDIYGVISEILGDKTRCPIILKNKSGYTLIAGNTRLMACRLIGIRPKVIVVKA
jgi:hypothetical protein